MNAVVGISEANKDLMQPKGMYHACVPWMASTERFLVKYLKLEHGANIFPLLHIVLFYLALYFLVFGVFDSLWINFPLWIGLLLANYSLSIGIMHMHAHRKLFTRPLPNRIAEVLMSLPGGVSYPVMKYIHVHLHHRYDDGFGDPTSTRGKETGLRALQYWIGYGLLTHRETIRGLFARDAKPTWKRLRSQYVVDNLLVLGFALLIFGYDPMSFLLFYLIPYLIVSTNIGYFAWLTHAPAREGKHNGSVNTVNNWMNLFIHNQGFHSLHHIKPSIHWTAIPDFLDEMELVDDDLIVPYWVTLESSYRIASPDQFRNEHYGKQWKQRYECARRMGCIRLKAMPYFAWV